MTDVHAARRQRLMRALGDGVLVLPTAPHRLRNGDTHHEFRPGSDFWWLTGFEEPEALLLLDRRSGRDLRFTLFVRPRDPEREIWDGRRAGVHGARSRFGADAAFPIGELGKQLPELLAGAPRIFHGLAREPELDAKLLAALQHNADRARRSAPPLHPPLVDPQPVLAALRVVKDADEVARLERAAAITAAGHRAAMAAARPGAAEYEVQAEVERTFRAGGARRCGYGSIVASGANACILHYVENDRRMRAGELLLVDAGAEYGMYTADITRTFPVSGRFTEPQRAVYEVVLRAQLAAIRAARPGAPWNAPHAVATKALTRGLLELGVLRGDPARLWKKQAFRRWYMHGTSHWLGMDVHDAGSYQDARGKPVPLRAGMVLTVEPGLYFGPRDPKVPAELRGIGVRIEDDVLVTRGGNRVLTAAAPKSVAEVEATCA
jgi:Xaa-Pro aminopeptidase